MSGIEEKSVRKLDGVTVVGAVSLLIWMPTALPHAAAQKVDCNATYYPGHVLVRFKDTATANARQNVHNEVGAQVIKTFRSPNRLELVAVVAGREQAAIAAFYNIWEVGPRITVPIVDEGPRCGDPGEDSDAITHAIDDANPSARNCS